IPGRADVVLRDGRNLVAPVALQAGRAVYGDDDVVVGDGVRQAGVGEGGAARGAHEFVAAADRAAIDVIAVGACARRPSQVYFAAADIRHSQVGDGRRRRIQRAVEHQYDAALAGHVHDLLRSEEHTSE